MKSSALAAGVRRLRGLMALQSRHEESDEHLLHAFITQHDDSAFAAIVHRYGPLVLGVCRRVLQNAQDAEDTFQATFFLLARNAATLRNMNALGSWLYGTAYRLALTAKRSAARRRKHEGSLGALTQPRSPVDPVDELSWREVRTILDGEIARLPENYRSVFVLCCLENMSCPDAARRLGLKEGTVGSRLTAARKRLARRLARRGVELPAVLAALTAAALPAGLMAKTVEMALAASAVPASLAELVQGAAPALMVSKAKTIAVVLLLVATSGSLVGWYRRASEPLAATSQSPAAKVDGKSKAAPVPREAVKTMAIHGRVLDPDGKPAAGARVYIDPQTSDEKPLATTRTGKDGRFVFTLSRSRLVDPETKFPLRRVRILAVAKGYGLDWQEAPLEESGNGATLRLVKDDVPIQGRILSLEGKPLQGIKVSVKAIEAFPRNDLDRALDAQRKGNQIVDSTEVHFLWYRHHLLDPALMATTGADGRFRLEGLGRERIVTMNVQGTGIHNSSMTAMTRRAAAVRGPYKSSSIYGAAFEYLAKPSRLIRGTVREKGTGKALAGIRINDMGLTDYVTTEAVTDARGHYELHGCPKGERYGLTAQPAHGQPYLLSSIAVQDTPGFEPLSADLELVRGIPCAGKVLDGETGQAAAGTIGYYPLDPNPNVTGNLGLGGALRGSRFTNHIPFSNAAVQADGSFRCVVLPGQGCLVFRTAEANRYVLACVDPKTANLDGSKTGLIALSGEGRPVFLFQEQFQAIQLIDVAKDTEKVSEIIRVAVARQVHGTVQDADGKPLVGARVRGLKRWELKTLPSEQFTVHGVDPRRPRRVYFFHETRRLIGSVEVKGTESKPLTVRLQPWAAVRGRLLDAEGRPLRSAKVQSGQFMAEDGLTDDQGRFRVEGLIPGLRYNFHYSKNKPSMSGTVLKGFIGKPGEVRDLGDVYGQPYPQE